MHHAETGWGEQPSDKGFFLVPIPSEGQRTELHTYLVIRSCILACISLNPPQSDGLSCPSGPSHRLPGYLMRNYPYLLIVLGTGICVLSFQGGQEVKEGRGRGMFG